MVLGRQVIYPVRSLSVHIAERPHTFLFDNGSLRAASTLSLRRLGRALAERLDAPVESVSLLHSSAVPAEELEGVGAELLEPALLRWLAKNPEGTAILLPLFFGPSAALTEYVPERLASIRGKFPKANVQLAGCLVNAAEDDTLIAGALADAARKTALENELVKPKVLVVDHGSPQPSVAAVRDHLGSQVATLLGDSVAEVGVASMERRPGAQYAFNDPLLSVALTTAPFDRGDVVVVLQFLSPGRHAGPRGDVAQICDEATRGRSDVRTFITDPIGGDPRVVEVLLHRHREAYQSSLRGSIKPTSRA